MIDPVTILAALGPLVVDAGKAAVQRWLAPDNFKPATIDDYEKMRRIDLDMFKAVSDAGGTNPTYPWVEAIVRLMRPVVALIVLGTWAAIKFNGQDSAQADNFAAAIGFYLFGDRTLFYARKK